MTLGLDRASFNQGKNAKFNFIILDEVQPTLTAKGLQNKGKWTKQQPPFCKGAVNC